MPTMDDYNTGNGATVRITKKSSSNIVEQKSILPSFASYGPAKASNIYPYLTKAITTLEELVKEGRWEELVQACKVLDSMVQRSSFSLSDLENDNSITLTRNEIKQLESLREELAFSLGQLRDSAISRRVFFFNRDDLQAVQQMTVDLQQSSSPDIPVQVGDMDTQQEEPSKLLGEAKEIVQRIGQLFNM